GPFLPLGCACAQVAAVQSKGCAGADSYLLIAAQHFEGAVDRGQAILRGADGQFALFHRLAEVARVVLQQRLVQGPSVIQAMLLAAPGSKQSPALAMGLHGGEAAFTVAVTQCLEPGVVELPTVAEIALVLVREMRHSLTPCSVICDICLDSPGAFLTYFPPRDV